MMSIAKHSWCRLGICLLLALLVLVLVGGGLESVQAQDSSTSSTSETNETPNIFWHILQSAGWFFGTILFLVSVALTLLIVLLAMDLRMAAAISPYFVDEFTDTVNKRRFKEAFELAKNDTTFLGRVLTAGMGRLQYGIEDARETAFNTVESVKAGKEQLITYLATIGTLGPMLGLVGTVYGMIQTFMVLAVPGRKPDAAQLAVGISHALVITLLGIGLAVPAIFFHAFFRNRLIRITHDTSNIADDLLTQMFHNSKKPPVVTAVPAPPSVVPAAVAAKTAQ